MSILCSYLIPLQVLVYVCLDGMASIVLWKVVQEVVLDMVSVEYIAKALGNADVTMDGTEKTAVFPWNKIAMMEKTMTKVCEKYTIC